MIQQTWVEVLHLHGINSLADGKDSKRGTSLELVVLPCILVIMTVQSPLPLPLSWSHLTDWALPSEPSFLFKGPRAYAMVQAKCCHTVLPLVCPEDISHTGIENLSALQGQAKRFMPPHYLLPGIIMCDNSTNLLDALKSVKFMHVSCLAHVLNQVVQQFLVRYQDILQQAR